MAEKWAGEMMSGNPIIDFQHKLALRMIKKLMQSLNRAGQADTFRESLVFFECYIIEHFGDEEQILREYKYPQYDEHKKQHDLIREDLLKIKGRLASDGFSADLVNESVSILGNWLNNHFNQHDRDMINYLKKFYPPTNKVNDRVLV